MTTATFDGLGRYLEIRKPTEQATTSPSIRYSYHVSKTTPSWVQTELLQSSTTWLRSRSYVDGLGRERETQTPSPGGGRIVTATVYDSRNLVTRQTAPYFNSSSFGANMATAAGVPTSGVTETRLVYDDLARVTARQHFQNNTFRWETGYVHNWPFHVEIPPVGAPVWDVTDMMGRTRARHLFTQGWDAETISYTYTARGELARVDDPAGNRTSYTYNYLGWPVEVREPNTGTVNYSYDRAGNVTTEQRPTSTLWHSYDSVNRPLQTRVGDATGQLLVRHWWDEAGEMGLLHRRRTWTPDPTAPWWRLEFDVTGYDARGRALGHSWVIPPEVPGLAGTYTAEFAYDTADHLTMTTYPAMGDLPSEALVSFYSPEGNPRQMLTTLPTFAWVVSDTTWDNVGRVTSRTTPAGVRSYGYDVVSGRLSNQSFTTQATGVVVQNDSYVWDAGGNLTSVTSNPANTAFRERQCFGYDSWNRLTWARTTSTTTSCSPSANHQHGPGPYAHSYNYNAINNLTSGPAGTYSYPTPGLGVSRPHAPTSINGVGHSWNAAGQLTSRTGQWSATYTPQGQTATITAGNQRTVYAYGPDAERVLTHTVNTATNTLTSSTLTLGNLGELTIDHATGSLQAARFLTMAGTTVAVRANDGTLTWPLGNHQGSIVATVTTAGATQRHLYTPYGAARTTPPATTATRGFLNQPHNTTHQLSHLHHRHYDPHSGIFTTVDPLVTATGTPYLYGDGNPATFADPNGLYSADWCERNGCTTGQLDWMRSVSPPGKGLSWGSIRIQPVEGAGVVKIDQFIMASAAGAPCCMRDQGNGRGFSEYATMSDSKVQIIIDFEVGRVSMAAAHTCDAKGKGCRNGRPWQVLPSRHAAYEEDKNTISVEQSGSALRVQFRAKNSRRDGAPTIDGLYLFELLDDGSMSAQTWGDPFPSELVTWQAGHDRPAPLFLFLEKRWKVVGIPRLGAKGWTEMVSHGAL